MDTPAPTKKPAITYADFDKLDIRIGEIKEVVPVEKSKKLLKLTIDLGELYGTVEILSGISEFYKPEDIIGKKVPVLANLEPRKMMGLFSNGMVLMADEEGKPIIFSLPSEIKNGLIVR